MSELDELQKSVAELTAQITELKTQKDAQDKLLEQTATDLKQAREANAVLVARIPSVMEPASTIEPEDDRTPEQHLEDGIKDFVDAIYYERFALQSKEVTKS